jgi:hypothetical protein
VQAKGLVKFRKHGVSRPKIPASHMTCPHVTIALSLPTPIPHSIPMILLVDPPSLIHHLYNYRFTLHFFHFSCLNLNFNHVSCFIHHFPRLNPLFLLVQPLLSCWTAPHRPLGSPGARLMRTPDLSNFKEKLPGTSSELRRGPSSKMRTLLPRWAMSDRLMHKERSRWNLGPDPWSKWKVKSWRHGGIDSIHICMLCIYICIYIYINI